MDLSSILLWEAKRTTGTRDAYVRIVDYYYGVRVGLRVSSVYNIFVALVVGLQSQEHDARTRVIQSIP